MTRIAMLIAVILISLTPATAEVFDILATGTWIKVQDGNVVQWSTIPSARPKTRIDFLSYIENGERITYYLIRSACPDGKVVSTVIKAGNRVGVGLECDGSTAIKNATVLNEVEKLPTEASALIKK